MRRAVSRLTTRHDIFAVPVTSLCEGEERRGGEERGGEGKRGEGRGGEMRGEEKERRQKERHVIHHNYYYIRKPELNNTLKVNLIYTDSSH